MKKCHRHRPDPCPRSGQRNPRQPGRAVLCCLAMVSGLTHAGLAEETWQQANGYRFRELSVNPQGHTGFSLVAPGQSGIDFTNVLSDEKAAENQIRLNGSGVALGDVDGDGWCDLYFCGLEGNNALYRNLGGWRFTNVTAGAGVACAGQFSTGATFADIDGDGDLDLLVNGIGVGTRLFLNDGHGVFSEMVNSGLSRRYGATTSTLADIDGDGDLDLYVANYRTTTIRTTGMALLNVGGRRMIRPQDREDLELMPDGRVLEHGEPHRLYRNLGGGKFAELPWTEGAFLDEDGNPLARPPHDWGLSAMFRDLNGDGAPDLYVCNDFHSPDRIWLNDGHGKFRAIPRLALRNTTTFSMAVDVADLNRDGLDDIFVADMLSLRHSRRMMQLAATDPYLSKPGVFEDRPQYDRNTLHLNRGDGTYAEIAHYACSEASEWTWSVIFIDVDLDGYEDFLCSTGHMFDTQDLDAEARIRAMGPWRRDLIPQKLLQFPRLQLPKVAFHNRRDLTFEEVGAAWGFDHSGVSHGMALADLDHDGDLDVVVNNLNAVAGIYRNDTAAPRVAVRLQGLAPNTQGIGAKIWLYGGAVPMQSQEMICGGRYLSSDEPMRVFAAGSLSNDMRIEVKWRNGKRSVVNGVKANRIYEIDEAGAEPGSSLKDDPNPQSRTPNSEPQPLFEEVSQLLKHVHHEDEFNDFERQPLLPKKLSQLGPGVAWLDLDGDGWEDLVIGTGKGGAMAAYRNDRRGGFVRMTNAVLAKLVTRDQTAILGWDKAPGRPVILAGSANYEDGMAAGSCLRQYDLAGKTVDDGLPGQESSTGPIALGDLDGDGNLDLFVGGRVVPGKYPQPATSLVFRSRQGEWELDRENTRRLAQVGLVSGAVWSDLDGDGYPELILACGWGPIRVFHNDRGQLTAITKDLGFDQYAGWWNVVATGDFDGDGRLDIVASNWGLNSKYRASGERPRKIYYGDLGDNRSVDIAEAYYDRGMNAEAPERDLNVLGAALPFVREKFSTYAAYGKASLKDIFGDKLQRAAVVEANTLATMIFLNRGDHFEGRPLPLEAQLAPAFAVCVGDVDGDGHEDLFLSQNFFEVNPESSRCDAGRGLWLKGDGRGNLRPVAGQESGVKVYGNQRGAALCDYDGDGRIDLVVTQNGAETKLFHNVSAKPGLRVRLKGPSGNPHGIGAQLRLGSGQWQGPVREIHAGGGYWSQDGAVQVMCAQVQPTQLQIRWPGGKRSTNSVPSGAREIEVAADGQVAVLRDENRPYRRKNANPDRIQKIEK